MSPSRRRVAAQQLVDTEKFSERRACQLIEITRASFRYEPRKCPGEDFLRAKIRELAEKHPRYGCPRIMVLLTREGIKVNKKRVHRIWKTEGLALPRKRPKRRRYGPKSEVKRKAQYPNHVWTYDLMEDRLENGGRVRILNIVDEFTRECLLTLAAKSITSQDVINALEWLFLTRATPEHIRSDNGPEFIAKAIQNWLVENGCQIIYITPGSPWENPYIESFNGKFRDECLNMEIFRTLREAKIVIELWRKEYNEYRPHSSLGYQTPSEFARRSGNSATTTPTLRSQSEKEVESLYMELV